MTHWFNELGKVISTSKHGVRVEWIGRIEFVKFGQVKGFKVGQWFEAEAMREGESISAACLSKTIEVKNVKRIGSLDKKLSDKEWEEVVSNGGIVLPPFDLRDL